ncbi:TPA: protein tyrosine phosphatase [Klebsiella pneumoniae]|uniref:arsenate reductase/protein-tyrosine-phosphatase family protein n=1 Tax=Gammaproteobacteria TaxID=1236 RepID=UPI000C7C34C0|nr:MULTISPECIES: protein tyrosine phosphatase [Klebsiella]HCI6284837.1 protein tyrosine phosphatase [Klebsiella quasipneumoniae subsp. similipneumoniae]HDS8100585.1 protein tyrosine phosphatase [Klebsiella pneumoniae subsp. pneumoniae]AZR62445.1 protein tyrosine phosphatase [Klebsiella quasipneumoniae]MBD8356491.1 protein tyrosine phosphatase [Klebsiella pneumoniae]MCQ0746101.1 protein tyrosine phosphatase [Klebsiella pneumoniae]
MFNSILVVCTGNICRSPIGERLLRKMLPTKKIDSAGTDALINKPADKTAQEVAKKYEVSLEGHRGRQYTAAMAREYDLILVMDRTHLIHIGRVSPEVRGKTMLLGHWMGQKDIPDPYRQGKEAFEFVYQLIEQSCQQWAEKLSS